VVETGEAAGDHPGRRAVAALTRAAKAEAGTTRRLHRVDRSAQNGGTVDVDARIELELGHEIAPVGWQQQERRLPIPREGARRRLGWRPRALGREGPEPPDDPLAVDSPEETPHRLGSDAGPAGRCGEADLVACDARAGRAEERSRAGTVGVVADREAQRDLCP